jgi:hypothetical protein
VETDLILYGYLWEFLTFPAPLTGYSVFTNSTEGMVKRVCVCECVCVCVCTMLRADRHADFREGGGRY